MSDGTEQAFDLFLGIPVHRAPGVVVDSGLTDDGWIAVDPATFVTKFPDVYAVGDITSAPVATRVTERALNPLLGKSLVVYLEKPA